MDFRFGCSHIGGGALLQAFLDEVHRHVDAFFRRSPHLDERVYPPDDEPAPPPRFTGHDAPIFLPPPR